MKHQLTGLKVSLLIHAAVFMLIFGVNRLLAVPSTPVGIEIGIFTSTVHASTHDTHEKIVQQLKRPTNNMEVAKPVVQEQKAPAETAVAEKPALKQGAASPRISASAVVGPVFDADYLKNPKPQYPPIARRLKLEGTVTVQVLVSPEGKPEIVRLGKSSGSSLLDQAALQAVQSWSFMPAQQWNRPVSAWVDVPIRFRLIE